MSYSLRRQMREARYSVTCVWCALVLAAVMSPMRSAETPDAAFSQWWAKFQSAVARGDAKAVADGATFPMDWENGPTRKIATEADFEKRFDFYFTPEIRSHVAKGKPERLPRGSYLLIWQARGNEYSLSFRPKRGIEPGGGFALEYLAEGPP
jgi:hypothetical protein